MLNTGSPKLNPFKDGMGSRMQLAGLAWGFQGHNRLECDGDHQHLTINSQYLKINIDKIDIDIYANYIR